MQTYSKSHIGSSILDIDLRSAAKSERRSIRRRQKMVLAVILAGIMSVSWLITLTQAQTATAFLVTVEEETDNINVAANEPFDIEVEVIDNSLNTVDDYTGTIQFTSTDSAARLPSDYTFATADAGQKSFDLGVTLVTSGIQTVTVTDADDSSILGEITINVSGSGTGEENPNTPVIQTPSNGVTVNTAAVEISGTTAPDAEVSLFDGTALLGKVNADTAGSFTFTTSTLFDGTHTFTASILDNGSTLTSDPVQIIVDTTAAVIQSVTITPPSAAPGESVRIEVRTESGLTAVKAITDQRAATLTESATQPGTYSGPFVAPASPGTYPVAIEVTDQTNNVELYEDQAEIVVTGGTPEGNQPPTATATAQPFSGPSPLTVQFTANATDPDGTIVSFAWNFGDGTTSSEQNPRHVYQGTGDFPVSLTVTDDGGATAVARITSVTSQGVVTVSVIKVLDEVGPAGVAASGLLLAIGLNLVWFNRKRILGRIDSRG